MDIKQSLPFTHCENCPEFVLDVNEQTIFINGVTNRFIDVKCKNEWLCKQLEARLSKEVANEQTMS